MVFDDLTVSPNSLYLFIHISIHMGHLDMSTSFGAIFEKKINLVSSKSVSQWKIPLTSLISDQFSQSQRMFPWRPRPFNWAPLGEQIIPSHNLTRLLPPKCRPLIRRLFGEHDDRTPDGQASSAPPRRPTHYCQQPHSQINTTSTTAIIITTTTIINHCTGELWGETGIGWHDGIWMG